MFQGIITSLRKRNEKSSRKLVQEVEHKLLCIEMLASPRAHDVDVTIHKLAHLSKSVYQIDYGDENVMFNSIEVMISEQ